MENVLVLEEDRPHAEINGYEENEASARIQVVPFTLEILEQLAFELKLGIVENQLYKIKKQQIEITSIINKN
jgi:hypothetical protein